MNFKDHGKVLDAFERAKEIDQDNRTRAREAEIFITKRNGQWEPEWETAAADKPRYQFDMIKPIRDQIMGDIEESDFDARVMPSGGESSEDIADTYMGLLRSIRAQSNADDKYTRATRKAVTIGFDCVRVVSDYVDGYSFDQDLMIETIPNSIDRVWFGYHNEPDASDADHCFVMTGIPDEEYKEKFPDSPADGLSADRQSSEYFSKPGLTMIGELIYLKPKKIELVKMSDGRVFKKDDDFKKIEDELKQASVTIKEERETEVMCAYSRRFNQTDWIDDEARELPFKHRLPVIPLYTEFDIVDEKVVYNGIVEGLMDPQRVLNYSLSREIEEGALAPRAKWWMTPKQAAGHEAELATMNTNTDPVQFYNPDEKAPGSPQQSGGAQINPGLRNISTAMREIISMSAGMFAANMGDNPGLQSGVAIDNLQERGDRANNRFLQARETFERAICKSLISAIPEIYQPARQIRLLGQDGTVEIATIGQTATDVQSGEEVTLHDVSRGSYEVIVTAAPSFKTRQSETVNAITEIAKVDPSVIMMGGDILLSNIPAPGMDELSARKRAQLFQQGAIPMDQMTQEELQAYQEMQQGPQEESPDMVLARAEQAKADAEAMKAQADMLSEQNKAQEMAQRYDIDTQKLAVENARVRLEAFIAEYDAQKAGMETKKIYADIVETLARAEKTEAEVDSTVTRIDEMVRGRQS